MSYKKKSILVIFGVCLALVFIEIFLQIGGFVVLKMRDYRKRIIAKQGEEYCILCIGESTTEYGGQEAYPKQLERILNTQTNEIKFKVINEGATGCNTTMILRKLNNNLEKYKPQMVIAMMGINDRILDIKFEDFDLIKRRPLFKNLRLYKFLKWWQAFARIKASKSHETKNKGSGKEEIIDREDINIKDNIVKARYLRERGEYEEALALFRKEAEINQQNYEAWDGLYLCYEDQEKFKEAEEFFKEKLKIYPENYNIHKLLGHCYLVQTKFKEAEMVYKRLIKDMNSKDSNLYISLGICYEGMGEFSKEKALYEKLLNSGIGEPWLYLRLGNCYWREGNYVSAEKMYLSAMELNPDNLELQKTLGVLGSLYIDQGRYTEAEELLCKASELRGESYNIVTWFNYLKLQKTLKEKGIKLVCMQYPMRPLKELEVMFSNLDGIIFADNEKIFKEALRTSKYNELFYDSFAGDFGHCTLKGSILIANNLANFILDYLAIDKTK